MPEFFLEIGTEEIPSGYIPPALDHMQRELVSFFRKNRIGAHHPRTLGTPRRLVVCFAEVDARQEDVVETHHGPNVRAAFDSEGRPTKAAEGFARSKGIDVSGLTTVKTNRGEVLCARVEKKGQPTLSILNDFLPGFIGGIPFPKKMRWADRKQPFARPVHWLVALFGGTPLDFQFDGIPCGARSRGHRFLKAEPFAVTGFDTYLKECQQRYVAVDPEARRQLIMEQLENLAQSVGGKVEEDLRLLNEVNFLVEYPVAVLGGFEDKYLELPRELLVMTMKHHQRYFPVVGPGGGLLPHFITISNMKPTDPKAIRRGNERVLRARLEDARFFFEEDRKKNLEDFLEQLKGVVFQKHLGTSYEKVLRFEAIARVLAQRVCPREEAKVARAARLCKADLVSQMVYEFPELQGVMGRYYAAHAGEDPDVALAIKEHYRPAFAGDDPPANDVGAVVAIADKLDTILGCIGVGLLPSGSEDPYALRRHAMGILQTVLARNWPVSLYELIEVGLQQLREKLKLDSRKVRTHALDLFRQRMETLLRDEGYPYDAVDAVLATEIDSIVDVRRKVSALSDLKRQPYFEPLAIAFRRVVSILNEEAEGAVDPGALKEPQEKALYEKYREIRKPVEEHLRQREFDRALACIVEIKPEVDQFFDHVMVMVEDNILRKNRLHLLYAISRLFADLADFSKIVLKKS